MTAVLLLGKDPESHFLLVRETMLWQGQKQGKGQQTGHQNWDDDDDAVWRVWEQGKGKQSDACLV